MSQPFYVVFHNKRFGEHHKFATALDLKAWLWGRDTKEWTVYRIMPPLIANLGAWFKQADESPTGQGGVG